MKLFSSLTLLSLLLTNYPTDANSAFEQDYFETAKEPGAITFNPPEGWHLANPEALPPSVKIMVVGTGDSSFPPSINLGTEKINGSIKDYLKTIKSINDAQGSDWKDLGTIRTQGGTASLSQVDAKTEWGEVRMMHVIIKRESTAYILTAAALKEEFSRYYKEFFKSMRSLRFNKDVYSSIKDAETKKDLIAKSDQLKKTWSELMQEIKKDSSPTVTPEKQATTLFNSKQFQSEHWIPFKKALSKEFSSLGPAWQKEYLNLIQSELTTSKP